MSPKRKGAEPVDSRGPGSEHATSKKWRMREHALTGRALQIHRARTADRTARARMVARLRSSSKYQQMDANQCTAAKDAANNTLMQQRFNAGISGDSLEISLPADDDEDDDIEGEDPVAVGLAAGAAAEVGGPTAVAPAPAITTEAKTIGRAVEQRMRPVIEF